MSPRHRLRAGVQGVVQGVGFRPFVYTTAAALGLTGSVRNDTSGAIIEIEGEDAAIDEFLGRLRDHPPPLAVVESIETENVPVAGGTGFVIADTTQADGGRTLTSPDVAMCDQCAAEQRDPADRRYRHAFINCTNCGPRFTIIAALPYDRAATAMAPFEMCAECAREYADPADRRFHAQPVCCPNCGPSLSFYEGATRTRGEPGLRRARALLRDGAVLGVKGIGGYHLACDAYNHAAVTGLRRRKRRGDKPFALMAPDLTGAHGIVELDADAARLLRSPARPIVVLPRRAGASVSESVAPRNPDLGVMLAYTPIHTLLFGLPGDESVPDILVMTSANLSGEPICYTDADALGRLSWLADGWLSHDREILVPCDDSVLRVVDGQELPIRRSRGYAPLPVALPVPVPPTLAAGSDLKNTLAVADKRYAWLSAHIGDMDGLAALTAFGRAARHLTSLTRIDPEVIVADAHPAYRSAAWAHRNANGRPVRTVQHHHAHIAAVMAEHGLAGPVLGFAFDGTGYGPDGAIWGGELLEGDYRGFTRLAHLKYVPLAGGDLSVLRPYRMALSHLWSAGLDWDTDLPPARACPPAERRALEHQLRSGAGCIPTSSMGRLFDAVSALIGVRQIVDYEAQAAIELEGLARSAEADHTGYAFAFDTGRSPIVVDPAPVLEAALADLRSGVSTAVIGARFHHAVAGLIVELAVARAAPGQPVALSGGVFQNVLLLRLAQDALRTRGFEVFTHRRVPPNDGGIALGQLLVGNAE